MSLLFLLVLLTSPNANASSAKDFFEVAPLTKSEFAHCEGTLSYGWSVSLDKAGNLKISKGAREVTSAKSVKVNGGELFGEDHGEWGGKLFWKKGSVQKELSEDNFYSIVANEKVAFSFGGTDHMGADSGHILSLAWDGDSFISEGSVELKHDDFPTARILGERLLYADSTGIAEILHGKQTVLRESNLFLPRNSIVEDRNGDVYVGMRYAVAKFKKADGFKPTWLVKDKCKN